MLDLDQQFPRMISGKKKKNDMFSLIHSLPWESKTFQREDHLQMDPRPLLCICFLSLCHGHLLRATPSAKREKGRLGAVDATGALYSDKWLGLVETRGINRGFTCKKEIGEKMIEFFST